MENAPNMSISQMHLMIFFAAGIELSIGGMTGIGITLFNYFASGAIGSYETVKDDAIVTVLK